MMFYMKLLAVLLREHAPSGLSTDDCRATVFVGPFADDMGYKEFEKKLPRKRGRQSKKPIAFSPAKISISQSKTPPNEVISPDIALQFKWLPEKWPAVA